ncbi:MAG: terminase family protein [Pyrinomonadaceae bacterium]
MIFVPPRHGKSELVTVRYAAWTLKNDPAKNVIIGSYGQSLANRFSRKIKRVLGDDWALTAEALRRREDEEERNNAGEPTYTEQKREHQGIPQCFSPRLRDSAVKNSDEECPFPFVSSRPKNTEAEWETSKGGGLRAVGVGAGVTGFGADLIIVDDPVKSRAEAESKTQREAVWNWFNDDLYTRLEPDGKIILIQTRWHEDDLAGRLLRQMNEGEGEHWDVINLSAIALGAGNAAAPGCNTGSSGVTALGREDREIQQSTFHLTAASDNTGRSIDPKHHHAGGTGVAGEGARVPVKVIGYPRLYSRLAGSAAAPGCNTGSSGVTAPPNEKADQYDPTSYSGSIDPNLHHAGGTGVAGEGTCVPVKDARPPVDQLDRQPGESLWPSRFSIEKLEQRRKQLGTYSFSSLYQQQPVPAEGGMFKREWFGRIISAPPPGLRWIRGYDLGVTATADSDYTASFRVAFDGEGNMYIDGGFRRRMEFPEQRRYILTRLAVEANTEHVIEGTLNGLAVVQAITSERPPRGHLVRAVKVRDPKTSRALEWINIAEQGRLLLVRGAWNEEFIDECCSFPLGTHDDQVDAVSLAVKARRLASNRLHRF